MHSKQTAIEQRVIGGKDSSKVSFMMMINKLSQEIRDDPSKRLWIHGRERDVEKAKGRNTERKRELDQDQDSCG